ncbi:glucoamylase family protein [Belliella aquatica]|uniref:Glycoamylase-like domain-containing protein n=1 Tax=Belliella aquatica TaxID=1323734 RepID=A0ABQ1MX48_9BACT|nr:glucoamylase family protein [Belliella aquatica]MCH7406432.1 Ig-like domain-containing protein [Belliella aquatica]GGC45976.1 hypothetical protein GCM10010993_25700 [Belliella aquatica]
MLNKISFILILSIALFSCKEEDSFPDISLEKFESGAEELTQEDGYYINVPLDRALSFSFSGPLDLRSISSGITFTNENGQNVGFTTSLISNNRNLVIFPAGVLSAFSRYKIEFSNLKGANGENVLNSTINFRTLQNRVSFIKFTSEDALVTNFGRIINVPLDFSVEMELSHKILTDQVLSDKITLVGPTATQLDFEIVENKIKINSNIRLKDFSKYELRIAQGIESVAGTLEALTPTNVFTKPIAEGSKFPQIPIDQLLTKVQEQTFRYFWDFGHPASGMARERNTSGNLVTVGGSGFGVMAILVGIERGFINRTEGVERLKKIVDFLEAADRFHGAWPHWFDGNTGRVLPFSQFDNGGDLVETAFMIQGLLTVRQYLDASHPIEKSIIDQITKLWEEVEWSWYTRGGQDVLYWHWSPQHEWAMNLPIRGYNESLLVYVLAAASPTHPITKTVYDNGWARNGSMRNGGTFYTHLLPLGESFGGPLFYSHYSFLGLDPRNLSDQYANYWTQGRNHTLINRAYCVQNPQGFAGISNFSWGLTASDNHLGYSAHSPTNDLGVITPTAALSSMPYTPEESIQALEFFYYKIGDKLWGEYGFYDAYNQTEDWVADSYLAIDQGPIIIMIENHRTALLWDLFMQDEQVKAGLDKLNFNY